MPPDWLNYAIVEKTREGKRLMKIRKYEVFRHVPDEMKNTSAVEHQNLTIRLLLPIQNSGQVREALVHE